MTGGGYEEFEGYRGGGGYYGKIIKAFLMAYKKVGHRLWAILYSENDNNI